MTDPRPGTAAVCPGLERELTPADLRVLVDSVHDLVVLYDAATDANPGPRFRYARLNRAAVGWVGERPERLLGRYLDEVLGNAASATLAERRAQARRAGGRLRYEDVVRLPSRCLVADVSLTIIDRPDGREQLLWVARDVSDRLDAELTLRRSEHRHRILVEQSGDLVLVACPDGTVGYASPAVERLLGRPVPARVDASLTDVLHPEDVPGVRAAIRRALSGGGGNVAVDVRVRGAAGEWRCFSATLTNLLDEPAVGGLVVFAHDVTEREWAKAFLDSQRRILQMISQEAPLAETLAAVAAELDRHLADGRASVLLAPAAGRPLLLVAGRAGRQDARPGPAAAPGDPPAAGPTGGPAGDPGGGRSVYLDRLRSLAAPLPPGPMAEALVATRPVLVADVEADSRWPGWRDLAGEFGVRACWCVPVRGGNGAAPHGVIAVHLDTPGEPMLTQMGLLAVASRLVQLAVERAEERERLSMQARVEPVTGLATQCELIRAVAAARAQCQTAARAVLCIGLERLHEVSASLGYAAGDHIVRQFGDRLRDLVADGVPARIGDDRFAVLLRQVTGPREAVRLGERVQALLRTPFEFRGGRVFLTAGVGVALDVDAKRPPEDLLRDADAALSKAREAGLGNCVLYDDVMRAGAMRRLLLSNDLYVVLERGQFGLHYQPEVDLRTGAVVGVEALLRWVHPRWGPVSPADFIPLAEATGLIVDLGGWVLERGCAQLAAWTRAGVGPADLLLSVNVSTRQLAVPGFVDAVTAACAGSGLALNRLWLEITETVLLEDSESTLGQLRRLHDLGVGVVLDDFGTGYSSLSYLSRFPVTALKIDRSFVSDADRAPGNPVVEAVLGLARSLGIKTVAEGVETGEQLSLLRSLACDLAQGYHIARPLPAAGAASVLGFGR